MGRGNSQFDYFEKVTEFNQQRHGKGGQIQHGLGGRGQAGLLQMPQTQDQDSLESSAS